MSRPLRPCQGLVGRILGHKYRARYDSKMPWGTTIKRFSAEVLEAAKDRTYRGDICERCGSRLDAQPTTKDGP